MPDLAAQLAASFEDGLRHGTQLYDDLKLTKAESNYRAADDSGGDGEDGDGERCGGCRHYDDSRLCGIVSGTINDDDVCDHYAASASDSSDDDSADK